MSLVKAQIEVLDTDAVDEKKGPKKTFTVQFNPTEYTLTKGAQIAEIAIPGIDSPILQFVRGQNEKLTLDLFFDTTNEGMGDDAQDVSDQTNMVYQLVKIQPKTHAPPRIQFRWGNLSFKAIVESITRKFTLFSSQGTPLRATLSVTFREYKTLQDQLKELNLQSSDHSKRYTVRRGDTLNRIAYEQYRDSSLWKVIADANNLTSPRDLEPGMDLQIPPIDSSRATRELRS